MTIQQAFEQAIQLQNSARLTEAEAVYRQILDVEPRHADSLHMLGAIAGQTGRNDLSVDLIRQSIALKPGFALAHSNLGNALKQKGQLDEAIVAFRHALALQPNFAMAHGNLGNALRETGKPQEAIVAYRHAIALQPNYPEAHSNLGVALNETKQVDEAIAACRRAIALQPNFAEAHNNLGNALKEKGQLDDAIAAYRQAIALKPNYYEVRYNLGNALKDKKNLDDAIASYREAIALKPDYVEALSNLGVALHQAGDLDESIAVLRQAIAVKPGFAEAHYNISLGMLLKENFKDGWEEMEWRWQCKDFSSPLRNFPQPQWDGGPLEGRTLLLHSEQGVGDALQFARYAPLVAQRGGRIFVECQPEIQRLLQTMAADLPVVPSGQPLPAFDVHCPLMSLPRLFATDLAGIPRNVPYVHARAEDSARWQDRLSEYSNSLKVGLVWAGNPGFKGDHLRSPRQLSLYAPLGTVPDVQFFSLQKGEAAGQTKAPPPGMALHDWTDELKDFADTASLMAELDLIITSDTSVAHLAGAMGRPVWVMLPFVADWRWLLARPDCPWYPTMRLFRQPRRMEWEPVVEEVRGELEGLVRSRGVRMAAG